MSNQEEMKIKQKIWSAASNGNDMVMFTNPCGVGWVGKAEFIDKPERMVLIRNPRQITFGLTPGSSDLIGGAEIDVTPDMIGRKFLVFVGIETKSSTGDEQERQTNFRKKVTSMGGIAMIARSVQEFSAKMDRWMKEGRCEDDCE